MQMRPSIQIQSVLKALTDVVLPAVDPQNKLAQEQARLAIGMLGLLARQLPLQFQFDRDELARLIDFSHELSEVSDASPDASRALQALGQARETASDKLAGARTSPEELLEQIRLLRSLSGDVITQIHRHGDATSQKHARDAVMNQSREQLLRDRAMLVSQGWEPDPGAIPSIEQLLAQAHPSKHG